MREILFKAKRIDNGEWVEGFYFCMVHNDGRHIHHFIMPLGADLSLGTPIEKIQVEIDIDTLCQYTGLTDKNGNKIWENDIVTHTYTTYKDDKNSYPPFRSEKKQKNYVIKFDSTASFLGYRYHNGRNIFPFKKGTVINGDDVVVGNIFDNPELLEV